MHVPICLIKYYLYKLGFESLIPYRALLIDSDDIISILCRDSSLGPP
jgi:hypothetical protein